MHQKDPWVTVNKSPNPGPRKKTWVSFLDCIKLHKLTIFSCDAAEMQRYYMQQHVRKPQRVRVRAFGHAWASSTTTWLIYPLSRIAPWPSKTRRKATSPSIG